jgi:hypothetical protein
VAHTAAGPSPTLIAFINPRTRHNSVIGLAEAARQELLKLSDYLKNKRFLYHLSPP